MTRTKSQFSSSPWRASRELRLAVAFLSLLVLTACGTSDRPPGLDDSDGGDGNGQIPDPTPCDDGASRACGVTLSQANGVKSCYRGTEYCDGGHWSLCTDGEVTKEPDHTEAQLDEISKILSISLPAKCIGNPCDPSCMFFDENPMPDLTGGGAAGLPSYPGQPPSCTHPLCTTGAALNASCNSCVSSVCAVNPACCSTSWTSACVDLVYTECANVRPPLNLCTFGLFSDSTVVLANRSSSDSAIGAYGDITVSTDSVFKGVISTGNITFANLNNINFTAPLGIQANGSVSFAASNSVITSNISAGGQVSFGNNIKISGQVTAGTNITGQAGSQIWQDAYAFGTITGVAVSPGTAYPSSGVTPPLVSLPPQTAGTSIPTLPTICTGTANFAASNTGNVATVTGPGSYGDVSVTNGATLKLVGGGTYYFKTLAVNGVLQLDSNGVAGATWDIRVCAGGSVSLDNNTKVQGAGVDMTNDSNGVLLAPDRLTLYYDGANTINMGVDVYWSGIMLAPRAQISKSNMNSPPTDAQIAAGTRAAPINGALWGHSLNVGTNAATKAIPKSTCDGLSVSSFFPATVCPVIDNGVPPAINEPCATGRDCQINHRCIEPKTNATCAHSKCMVGNKLNATCDECVQRVCAKNASCCTGTWSQACVDLVASQCDATCGASDCGQAICDPGPAINATCSTCVADVCAAMPSCCTTAWTSACVDKVYDLCGSGVPRSSPIGTSICDYSVYGNGAVAILGGSTQRVTIKGGKVGGQGLGALSIAYGDLYDDVLTAGTLSINFTNVHGSVVQNGAGAISTFVSTIDGQQISGANIPTSARPTRTLVCAGVPTPTGGSIAPGNYGAVSVPDGGTLTLSAGTYSFSSLTLGTTGGAGGSLALPATGRVTINVCGPVTFNTNSRMTGLAPSRAMNVDIYATGAITLYGNNTAYGILNSDTQADVLDASTLYGIVVSGGGASVKSGSVVDTTGLGDSCRALGLDPGTGTLSSSSRLCAYAAYAGTALTANDDTNITGDAGAGPGGVGLDRGVFKGNILTSGSVGVFNSPTVVQGDIRATGTIGGTPAVYGSKIPSDASVPAVSFPTYAFTCPTGGASYYTGGALAPGLYGDVQAGWGNTLTLSAGTYYMSKLSLYDNSTIVLPATGTVKIYVCGQVFVGQIANELGIGAGADSLRFQIFSNDTGNAIQIQRNVLTKPWNGVLVAPRGALLINNDTRLNGLAWGKTINTGSRAIIDSTGATGAACEALGIDARPPCPVTLTPTTPGETALCVTNAPTYKDTTCSGYDLAVGVPCGTTVPVCNHGTVDFAGSVQVGYWADAQRLMSVPAPATSPDGVCTQVVSIAAGACTDVTCAIPTGTYTVMVDPNATLTECDTRRLDNWSVSDGRACGAGTAEVVYDYEATCTDPATTPRWGLLTWNTQTPGAATITFAAKVAKAAADLNAGSYTTLGVARLSPDTQVCGNGGPGPVCPIDLTQQLTLPTSQGRHLRMRMQFSGSAPVLREWKITYSCVFDQ